MTDNLIIDTSVIVSIIIFASQVLKYNFNIKVKYIPIINVILGCIFNFILNGNTNLLQGAVIGMTASGFYDICKQSFKKELDLEVTGYELD